MIKILISVLHYKNAKATLQCIKSVNSLNMQGMEVTLLAVDNKSPEKLLINGIEFSNIKIKTMFLGKNLGFSGGHNVAFDYFLNNDFNFILVLNNDTVLDANALKGLISAYNRHTKTGIVVPKIYFTKGKEFHASRYKKEESGKVIWYAGGVTDWKNIISKHIGVDEVDRGQFDEEMETEFATGACMLLSREAVSEAGDFDERYFLYYEDGDLNMRIKKKGYKIIFAPKAIVWHDNAGSSSSGSTLHDYYITRNRMIFGMKYAPLRSRIHLIKESLRLLHDGREWQKKGITDYYKRKFGKGSYNP